MQLGGMLKCLRQYKEDALKEFIYKYDHLSSTELLNLFNIKYSENENDKDKEEDVIYNFTNFLDTVQRNPAEADILDFETAPSMDEAAAQQVEDGGLRKMKVQIEDILQFLTGSKFIGSLKEIKGEISFCRDGSSGKKLRVNTCGPGIIFPLTSRYIESEMFSSSFVEDIHSAPGSGMP
eukprot:gene18464-20316_t